MPEVSIQQHDFDTAELQQQLTEDDDSSGALACFTGLVRADNEGGAVRSMELEHYPGMTERSIQAIVDEARLRWAVRAVRVVHRVGRLLPGEQIVYVGVTSSHRGDAFQACEFIMDYLKTRAPFWKKEHGPDGGHWVDARQTDIVAARRWESQRPNE